MPDLRGIDSVANTTESAFCAEQMLCDQWCRETFRTGGAHHSSGISWGEHLGPDATEKNMETTVNYIRNTTHIYSFTLQRLVHNSG